jgi:FkbM family methyltransferase
LPYEVGIYRRLRAAYWRALKPALYRRLVADRERLRPYVPRNSLVFDIGANRGDMTALFQDLGARVIAVEPVPELAAMIKRRFRATVEQAAVADEAGEGELTLGLIPNHSTMSSDYERRFGDRLSGSKIPVQIVTLDGLRDRHGMPDFVKIDVEGFENAVLRGLSQPVRALTFEFQRDLLHIAEECCSILERLGPYRFRFAENHLAGSSPLWPGENVRADVILSEITRTMPPAGYGDIYAVLGDEPVSQAAPHGA